MLLNRALLLPLLLAGCAPAQPEYVADKDYDQRVDAAADAEKAKHPGRAAAALSIEPMEIPVAAEAPAGPDPEPFDAEGELRQRGKEWDASQRRAVGR